MMHSDKILAQQIVDACQFFGVSKVVISPGSRNAPLIIEFNACNTIEKFSLVDERSAAFFALGMAQETKHAVALVCSSGSALLNYYPAIAEAFYSKIPLVIISADRPKHLIDIGDGQTIRQEHVFSNHILYSANLDETKPSTNYKRINKAFSIQKDIKGPIHFNIPFNEPLYQTVEKSNINERQWLQNENNDSLLSETPIDVEALQIFANKWNSATKKMIILGVYPPDEMIQTQLNHLSKDPSVIVLTENTSNVHHQRFINNIDQVVFSLSEYDFELFSPDILITFGGMVVSKKIKQLLRKKQPAEHWHIDSNSALNTYHCLTHHFPVSPSLFFSQFFFLTTTTESTFQNKWLQQKSLKQDKHKQFLQTIPFSDLKVFQILNNRIPDQINIQFSNSSIIRYAQLFNWKPLQYIGCNRGTSGIDGSTSTAVGVSVASKNPTLFITGDISFLYDSNAFWNKYIPSTFRIIVLNNNGGGIFRFIPGPTSTHTLDYFETPHGLNAKPLCNMHHIDYESVTDEKSLEESLLNFFNKSKQPKLLEIFTPSEQNASILKNYFE